MTTLRHAAIISAYGLDQCMDWVDGALAGGRGDPKPSGDDGREGSGVALARLECGPPTEHRSAAEIRLLADGTYHLAVGSTEMGNGSVTSHRQIAAELLGCAAGQITIINADTDLARHDTGSFASTGTAVAGQTVALAAQELKDTILVFVCGTATGRLEFDAAVCGKRIRRGRAVSGRH